MEPLIDIASGIGTGRLLPTVVAVVGLIGVIIGGFAVSRSRRASAAVAMACGLISGLVGALHAANAAGGVGTGNGLAGAVVAMVLGVVGIGLGGLAWVRSRRG